MVFLRVIVIVVVLLVFSGCRKQPAEMVKPHRDPGQQAMDDLLQVDETAQLLCEVENLEEAQDLAERYGIILVDCQNGYACFYTEEDPNDVILRGKAQGWPLLSLNQKVKLS